MIGPIAATHQTVVPWLGSLSASVCLLRVLALSNRGNETEERGGTMIRTISANRARRRARRVHCRSTGEPDRGRCPRRVIGRSYRMSGNDTDRLRPRRGGRRGRWRSLGRHRPRRRGYAAPAAASGCCGLLTGIAWPRLAQRGAGRPRPPTRHAAGHSTWPRAPHLP
jgi:hypothetical protein